MQKILVINGPNLNLLGSREPNTYGTKSLTDLELDLKTLAQKSQIELLCFQSNLEGEIINAIHDAKISKVSNIIINPGAYGHTSIALRDALLGVAIPFIEVHISNIYSRESFRHKSYLSDIAFGVIIGLGTSGYTLALQAIIEQQTETTTRERESYGYS